MTHNHLLLLVPSLRLGGQERVAINTANILKDINQVTIAVFDARNMVYDTDVEVVDLHLPATKNPIMRAVNVVRRVFALRKLKREREIACTLSFGQTANIANVLSRINDRIVLSVHGYRSVPKTKFEVFMWRHLYHRADVVFCVAKKITEDLARVCKIPRDRVFTVYNPYDMEEILKLKEEPSPIDIQTPAVVSVGRMQDVKGFRHLLRAVKLASEKIPELTLVLVGDGAILPQLKRLAEKLGIQDRIQFTGFQKNPFAIVGKCSCYVLSSINEGFPNAMIEAMACGIPMVAVDCKTGPREILDFDGETPKDQIELCEYGILFPPFESDFSHEPRKEKILADAIVKMLSDGRVNTAYRVRSELRARMFSFEQYRERILDILFLFEE